MALDPTAREANLMDSIKKYFLDIADTETIPILFDTIFNPDVDSPVDKKWIEIDMGVMDMQNMSRATIYLRLYTQKDGEGFKLAQLRDTIYGYLVDSDQTDGLARMTMYRSHVSDPWTEVGHILLLVTHESQRETLKDKTKHKWISVDLRWGTKI